MSLLNYTDLVLNKTDSGEYIGGGYKINNNLLNKGINPLTITNVENNQVGGNGELVSSMFKNLVVPTSLLYLQQNIGETLNTYPTESSGVIEESTYDKLLSLISPETQKNYSIKTRKRKNKSKNKTRKR